MRCIARHVTFCVVSAALALGGAVAWAQGPGGPPGMPMQRLGPSRGPATGMTGMGTPGAPMARMGRSGGGFSTAASARRSYGVGGVMSSQNFRASNLAGQARGAGMQRSSSAIIGSATMGRVQAPQSPR